MRFRCFPRLVCCLYVFSLGWSANAADFHVATFGNDAWSGTVATVNQAASDGPLASLAAAQQRVRTLRQQQPNRQSPIVVELAEGTYFLEEPLAFSAEDSGTPQSPVIYQAAKGARPVISGGVKVSQWRTNDQGEWYTDLEPGAWSFSQMFVNDQRRFRPRWPEQGYYKISKKLEPSDQSAGKGHDQFGFAAGELNPNWQNLQDVEIVAFHHWTASRIPIAEVDDSHNRVRLGGHTTGLSSWAEFKQGHRYFAENVKEALRKPGQWYFDRPTRRLTYIPRRGETLQNTTVIVPKIKNLLLLRGEVARREWVQHLGFRGLTFAHANWSTPPTGQSFPQAEINLGAAIAAMGARYIDFDHCAVRHVGEYAMGFGPGCQHNRVTACELVDLGAGGIKIGSSLPTVWGNTLAAPNDDEALVSHHTIEDCLIAHAGRLHSAGIGVWVGHSPHNAIRHNDVFDLYYSAFSLGWVWGYGQSRAHHNEVASNHAFDIGQGVLSDMGCIYTLGISPGTSIQDNHFHDVISYDYGGWGLYTDEGSTGVTMRNNLVYRCSRGGFHQHYGKENRIENNIFAEGGQHQLQRTRSEDHTSFTFERNLVYWTKESPLLGSNWSDNHFRCDHNLYWNGGRPIRFADGLTLHQWQQERDQDTHSQIADPGFVDPANGDFHLKADSPAFQVGFVPFDYTAAGRRIPLELTADLPEVPAAFE
ncbi:right-handed parallel beta-helix repeat-containing protein [Novipirellula artificiosorum]|uniref:Right handed beta helix domain-containing protein n=1 Tax=Novipirellula artificiosorum TaxID=2528016 RepID=A0A5C6E1V6_9BACT|nr:right-handed parallel beta-helix repeat-containing protein [Novipirellula artificiosorum]TWU41129.1 hypothetical protein Poly41_19670 [Novipirellula artificiosorum]